MSSTTETPQTTVEAFFAAWADGRLIESIQDFCGENCVWSNTGFADAVGRDAMVGMMQAFIDNFALATIEVTLRNVAVNGDTVLTERVDSCFRADGTPIYAIDVSGTLEVSNGKIVQFRDYWDPRFFLGEA